MTFERTWGNRFCGAVVAALAECVAVRAEVTA
jgi:hypothetical protein